MNVYFETAKFSYKTVLVYPLENFGYLIRKLVNLSLTLLFWFAISKSNPSIFDFRQMLSYILISGSIVNLTFSSNSRLGRDIQKLIANGKLTNTLIKPVDPLKFMLFEYIGHKTSVTIYELASFIIGILIYPPTTLNTLPLFILSLILTFFTGFAVNILIGTIGFYTPEAGSIHNVYEHINRILSGALIPLTYFPQHIKIFAYLTPFPVLTFYPTSILMANQNLQTTLLQLGLSAFWAVVLLAVAKYLWTKSLKNYDGVGI